MPSPEVDMKVTINPLTLSGLLTDLSIGSSETEGMLLGKISKSSSTTMGDHDIDDVNNSYQIHITGHFSSKIGDLGDIDDSTITYRTYPGYPPTELPYPHCQYKSLLANEFKESRVVGWFRFSARSVFSPIMPSIHDLVKHKLLQDLIPEDIRAGFVFLSVTESYNQDCGVGVKGFDRALFSIARIDSLRANWERIELHVPNLGDTDAGKRYSDPRVDVDESAGTKLEENIVRTQRRNLDDLSEYSRLQVEHCNTSLAQYLELYEGTEGPLLREILELERRLSGVVVTPSPAAQTSPTAQASPVTLHPIFATESLTETTASTASTSASTSAYKDLNDDEDSLPSPSIQGFGKGSSYDWDESQDVIAATQFHHDSPSDIVPETQEYEDSRNGMEKTAADTASGEETDVPAEQTERTAKETNKTGSVTVRDIGRNDEREKMEVEGEESLVDKKGHGSWDERSEVGGRAEQANGSSSQGSHRRVEKVAGNTHSLQTDGQNSGDSREARKLRLKLKRPEPEPEPIKADPKKAESAETDSKRLQESKKTNGGKMGRKDGEESGDRSSKRRNLGRDKSPSL